MKSVILGGHPDERRMIGSMDRDRKDIDWVDDTLTNWLNGRPINSRPTEVLTC